MAKSSHAFFGLLVASILLPSTSRAADTPEAKPAIDFSRQIRPILSDNCFRCHGPDEKERKARLRLDLKDNAFGPLRAGGRAIVPGQPRESGMIQRILADDPSERMPPARSNKKLTSSQIELLKQWVAQGAPWAEHWSFVMPKRAPIPKVARQGWARNAIDDFILSRLEREQLHPAPEADRATLLRRLTLDLTGLPPSPAEVDAFLADQDPGAYEKAVDRLLASPHYGERMAVDWLDAARFADTHGYHIDSGRDMTRWRDYVIDAFNANLPFDRFTVEQLAGDLLPTATASQKVASGFNRNHMINFEGGAIPQEYHNAYIVDRVNTTATVWLGLTIACAQCHDHKFDPISQKEFYQLYAFFHNVPENGLDGSKGNAAPFLKVPTRQQEQALAELDQKLLTLEQQLLAPNPRADAAQAAWELTALALDSFDWTFRLAVTKTPKEIKGAIRTLAATLITPPGERTDKQKAELLSFYRTQFSTDGLSGEIAKLRQTRAALEKQIPTTMVMQEMPAPRDTFILLRGEYDKKGAKVTAGVPAALSSLPQDAPPNRLGFARWLVDGNHPLTARVIVNRYWQMIFGTGLVKTAEDFGSQGEQPSHPDLMDWLAVEFMTPSPAPSGTGAEQKWSVRDLIRLIVTSATYRQSARAVPELIARDPENRLLARGPRFRLQAEFIRDQALAISGLLNRDIGGASVSPYQPTGLWQELASRRDSKNWSAQFFVQSHGKDLYRRTMYTFWKRTSPPPQLLTFDAPDRETCTVRRGRTNTPLQALVLMNDPTYVEAGRKFAERLLKEAHTTDDRLILAFRLATARTPTAQEVGVLRQVLDKQLAKYRGADQGALQLLAVGESPRDERLVPAELAAWTIVASVIMNLDETLTKG